MSPEERKAVGRRWSDLAVMFSKTFPNSLWTTMLNAVDDLPADQVCAVLDGWMVGKKARQFPLPIDVREEIQPPIDDDTLAREAAARIAKAIPKYGFQSSAMCREAREFIGELGWAAVERSGGWRYVCEHHGTRLLPATTFHAQVRDICNAQVKLAKAGMHDQPIGLPAAEGGDRETLLAIEGRLGNDRKLLGENL